MTSPRRGRSLVRAGKIRVARILPYSRVIAVCQLRLESLTHGRLSRLLVRRGALEEVRSGLRGFTSLVLRCH